MLVDNAFLLGFNKPFHGFRFGISDKAFGFAGASGALAFADPDAQVGYAYAPNKIDIYGPGDPLPTQFPPNEGPSIPLPWG